MKRALDDYMNINTWTLKGSISIWRYEPINKNFPGWHMTADDDGYGSLLELIELLEKSDIGSKRTVTLSKPEPGLACADLKETPEKKVVISLGEPEAQWSLENGDDNLFFKLGLQSLARLRSGIVSAKNGDYDFSVSAPGGQNLWFW